MARFPVLQPWAIVDVDYSIFTRRSQRLSLRRARLFSMLGGARLRETLAISGILQWTAPDVAWQERQAIGKKLDVMFLGTHTGD